MAKHTSSLYSSQSGQIAVVVLLIMVVLLTIGLSLAARTTQELFLSGQQSDSARVFNAAESGIEEALRDVSDSGTLMVDGISVAYSVNDSSVLETRIVEGSSVHLNLSGYTSPITIDWAKEANCSDRASFVATLFYDTAGETMTKQIAFGPSCDGHSDNFTNASTTTGTYFHRYVIAGTDIPTGTTFMRLQPVYADTDLKIAGSPGFPTQYHVISSRATYPEGNEERNIQVSRTLPAAPAYMDYALYSGGSITQQP